MRIRRWVGRVTGRSGRRIIRLRQTTRIWLFSKLLARLFFAAFLIFATYNPTGQSWYHWMLNGPASGTLKAAVTLLLAVAYGVVIPVTWRALGFGGIVLTISLATTTTWVMIEAGWINLTSPADAPTWITLSIIAIVLGVGSCWMLIGRVIDGQLRTRDITR
jgi:hypothetical protein